MPSIEIQDMTPDDEYFVSTCSHINESSEIDACGERRKAWLREMCDEGLMVKVALLDDKRVGMLYALPIEVSPWGPLGHDLLMIPCLFVLNHGKGKGAGRALIAEAEKEAKRRGKNGIVTLAFHRDFWFMPASFFEKMGFTEVDRRGEEVIIWKAFDPSAEAPKFLESTYEFKPISGKVVIDLFWNRFCQTSEIEAERVREVTDEFSDKVVLNEYPAHERETLLRYQHPRGIFVNGKEIFWGYEAPKEGIREAVEKALGE